MMDIDGWRVKIDTIDEILVDLLNRRAEYVLEIGKIKRASGQLIHSPEREMTILNRVLKLNKGPLKNEAVKRLFEKIIDESRRLEKESLEGRNWGKERE